MDTDRDIQNAIASGERNKNAMELIHNWCQHARVQKFGGIGIIEMETGLPIGHHNMACDHAPAGGFAAWDLSEAALDFHDRNCVTCVHRVPVRLPNLTTLLQNRDFYRKRAEEEKRTREAKAAAQLTARQLARQTLRAQLGPLSATIVDYIEEMDRDSRSDAGTLLLGSAQLAPETFTPAIVEYCFSLLEAREEWFDETGLRILNLLQADQARLTRCAMHSLGEYNSITVAAEIVEANSTLIDEILIADALPALVGLAYPERIHPFSSPRVRISGPLIAVFQAHCTATENGINKLLDGRDPYLVSSGIRAILFLAQNGKSIASRFSRSLVTKLARAHLLIDSRETDGIGNDEVIQRLQEAIALALEDSPNETDALMAKFIASASSEGEVRIYKVYGNALDARHHCNDGQSKSNAVARVSLRRLINAATSSTNKEVLREVQNAFSYVRDEYSSLAREELTSLLGAAMLIDDRIQRFDAEPATGTDFLSRLERQNHRHLLLSLQHNLIEWAACGASGNEFAIGQYIEILGRIPEGHDQFRSVMIRNTHRLMEMPDGLNAVLPVFYTSMVCSSTLVRAAAAEVVGKLNRRCREDVPELLYEALTVLLADPYVIVHHAAVEALEHLTMSKELDRRAKTALAGWIDSYAVSNTDDRFLLKCINLYLRKYATDLEKRGIVGSHFVALLDKMKPDVVVEKLGSLRHHLLEVESFAPLVIRILADSDENRHRLDDILRVLNDLPISAIQEHKSQLEAIAVGPNLEKSLPANLVETLTRGGAWVEAARINDAIYAKIPDTMEKRSQKLMANLDRIATKYEEAISLDRMDLLPALAQEWRITEAQIEEDRIKYAQQRSPFTSFPGAY